MRPDPLAEAAQAAGVRVSVTPEADARSWARGDLLHSRAHRVSERWSHATARIFRIIEGAGQSGARTTVAAATDAEMPLLAAEYLREFKMYQFLRYRESDDNPYRGLSERDAARRFMRVVEDICDRSTGRMGPWR